MRTPGCWGPRTRRVWVPYTAAKYSGRNEIAALLLERGVELDFFAACMAGAAQSVRSS